jgi:hypothetical protein
MLMKTLDAMGKLDDPMFGTIPPDDDEALHAKCFPCHHPAKDRDYVFTRYAPTP